MRKEGWIILVLAVLLLCAAGYILYGMYKTHVLQQENMAYQQGINFGAQQAAAYLFQQASACKQVSVTNAQNQTLNVIATECLQKQGNSS